MVDLCDSLLYASAFASMCGVVSRSASKHGFWYSIIMSFAAFKVGHAVSESAFGAWLSLSQLGALLWRSSLPSSEM